MTTNNNGMVSEEAKRYHEECVLKVKKHFEEGGYIVYRTGYFDILSEEEYDSKMPLPLRLSKLSADLKVMKNDKEVAAYVEVKTEDIQDERKNLKLNATQMAYFIHQLNQKGVRTMYSYFQRDGLEKGWWADDLNLLETIFIEEGDADAREYVESAIQILKERRKE